MEIIKSGATNVLYSDNGRDQQELEIAAQHAQTNFSISELQQAYWLGEQGVLRLSTPAIAYKSYFASILDFSALKHAFIVILKRHPMLRSKVLSDGSQIVSDAIPSMATLYATQ
ncbi:MAG TPA: hypothetical protein VGM27_23195 [Acidobacteriaceae bacterium]